MNTQSPNIVQRLWNYCNVPRDDGMSYGDYVEQPTYLLFLKMDTENASMLGRPSAIPGQYYWASLQRLNGNDLETHYRAILMKQLWIHDLRANMDFTLKTNPLMRGNLDEFVKCFHADNRFERTATWLLDNELGRWRCYTYEELMARDKVSLDISWLRDESLEDSANLPAPDVLSAEIVEDLKSAFSQFEGIADELEE